MKAAVRRQREWRPIYVQVLRASSCSRTDAYSMKQKVRRHSDLQKAKPEVAWFNASRAQAATSRLRCPLRCFAAETEVADNEPIGQPVGMHAEHPFRSVSLDRRDVLGHRMLPASSCVFAAQGGHVPSRLRNS